MREKFGDEESSYKRYLASEAKYHKKGYGKVKKMELLHPLWDKGVEPLQIGDTLFRGTSSKFVTHDKVVSHGKTSLPTKMRRVYFSEGEEDAAGYACMASQEYGGKPILLEVELTQELAMKLKPGGEGMGEWYVEVPELSVNITGVRDCHPVDKGIEECDCPKRT